jgi:hypothetical protein
MIVNGEGGAMRNLVWNLRQMRITNMVAYIGLLWSASAMLYISVLWCVKGDFTFNHVSMVEVVAAGILTLFAVVKLVLWVREAVR